MSSAAQKRAAPSVLDAMRRADELAAKNTHGGPFGSVIVGKDGTIIGEGRNEVVHTHNPTCHAEMQALRDAGKRHGHWNLKGATLITSCECCPMCLAGAYAAGVDRIIYANTRKDAADIGFADDDIYEEMKVGYAHLPIERVSASPLLTEGVDAVVVDATGAVLGKAAEGEGGDVDPTGLPSVLAVGRSCAGLNSFHLPDGCTLITRKIIHPLGFTAARWAHIERIVSVAGEAWEGADRSHAPADIYHDIALPESAMNERKIPMTRVEDTEVLKQTLATFSAWFNDQSKVLY
ncbi:MAG: nucleoside deaminase [Rickettsiales bacterium]